MRNPISSIFKPISPVKMEPPLRFNYSQPSQPEKPWPIWVFILYVGGLGILWLLSKPIIDALVTNLIYPLHLAGYLQLFFDVLPYIVFFGLLWIGFRKTFKREGE